MAELRKAVSEYHDGLIDLNEFRNRLVGLLCSEDTEVLLAVAKKLEWI